MSEPGRAANSKRFIPSKWTQRLVPVLLILLLLALLITLGIVLLAVLGLMPASALLASAPLSHIPC